MTIEKKIQVDFLNALKSKNAPLKNLLSTIKGEMQTLKKNLVVEELNDEDSIKLINKFAKGVKETISLLEKSESGMFASPALISARFELNVLESYLPKQMSEMEINQKLDEILASGISNMGQIMKEFANLPVDKKLVSDLVRKKIS